MGRGDDEVEKKIENLINNKTHQILAVNNWARMDTGLRNSGELGMKDHIVHANSLGEVCSPSTIPTKEQV